MYISTVKLSSRGQIALPKKVREALGTTFISIYLEDQKVTIAPVADLYGALAEFKPVDPNLSWSEMRKKAWMENVGNKYLKKAEGK